MKTAKRLTKKERKALAGPPPAAAQQRQRHLQHQHIHCVACGKHLDIAQFDTPSTATFVRCEHLSEFPSCMMCVTRTRELLAEHDRTGQPVKSVAAWH
ncbi:MAG: hypothetical protein MUF34_35170 [Polyangiaceae bacterium]|jgi:hypothetical protein|nr:hypothetical protein [Polyangiaceae bacterium]